MLQQQSRGWPKRGWTLYSASSRSSCCSREPTASSGPPTPPTRSTSPATTTRACRAPRVSRRTRRRACAAVGIDVYQIDHEDANGQFEINFTYADALTSADNFTFVKMAASEIARKHGMIAHVHAQAVLQPHRQRHAHPHLARQRRSRRTCSTTSRQTRPGAVELAYQFLGGLLAHARALAAVCAPTVNSYKRLVVGRALSGATWAPAYIAYGDNNRTAMRAHSRRPPRAAPDGFRLQSLSRPGRGRRRRHRRHRPQAGSGRAHNFNMYELTPERAASEGHRRCCRRTCSKPSLRWKQTRW